MQFQKTDMYKRAKKLNNFTSEIVATNSMERIVKNQLNRAALKLVSHISEAWGRTSENDKRHYFVMARSALYECVSVVDVYHNREHKDPQVSKDFKAMADELEIMLNTVIHNLGKKRQRKKDW